MAGVEPLEAEEDTFSWSLLSMEDDIFADATLRATQVGTAKSQANAASAIKQVSDLAKVTLDVGGKIFATTVGNLKKVPGSALEALVLASSAEIGQKLPLFIDRDPAVFDIILQFLREYPNSNLCLSHLSTQQRTILKQEAVYFAIGPLFALFPPALALHSTIGLCLDHLEFLFLELSMQGIHAPSPQLHYRSTRDGLDMFQFWKKSPNQLIVGTTFAGFAFAFFFGPGIDFTINSGLSSMLIHSYSMACRFDNFKTMWMYKWSAKLYQLSGITISSSTQHSIGLEWSNRSFSKPQNGTPGNRLSLTWGDESYETDKIEIWQL